MIAIVLILLLLLAPDSSDNWKAADSYNYSPKEDWIDEIDKWWVKKGDNLSWQHLSSFDSSWFDLDKYELKNVKGNWWIATIINISDTIHQNKFLGILPDRIVSAVEIYWDDSLLYSNGKIGHSHNSEVLGKYFQTISIPGNLASQGQHFLALRISNWSTNSKWTSGQIFIGYYESLLKLIFIWQIKIYFLIGILFLAFLFSLFLFFTSKLKINYLLFSLICLGVLSSLLTNYYWVISQVSNNYLDFKNVFQPICVSIVGVLFPFFFLYEFNFPKKKIILFVAIIVHTVLYMLYSQEENLSDYTLYALLVNVLILSVWGLKNKKEGSLTALLGIAISVLFYMLNLRFGIDNLTFFSTALIFCYIFSISKKYAKNEKQKNEAYIKSIRLENQLLKKNINPHYLLNSLTSIIVWLRREPGTAVKLVEALAEEFRIVSQISNLEKISIKKELELCETQLKIMSFRRFADFKIDYVNIDFNDEVPPMIFHTLVENGVTHGYEGSRAGKFILTRTKIVNGVQYKLFNDGSSNEDIRNKVGTGLKYVQARLEESYPDHWSLISEKVNGGWEVKIEIYQNVK